MAFNINSVTTLRFNTSSWLFIYLALSMCIYHLESSLATDELLYDQMSNYLNHDIALKSIERRQEISFSLMKYGFQLVWIVIRIVGVILLFVGVLYLYNVKLSFSNVLSLAILPYFIFLFPDFLKIVWFNYIQTDYNINDLYGFPNFSVSTTLELFQLDSTDEGLFLKRLLNIFNVYNFIFCYGFSRNLLTVQGSVNVYTAVFAPYFLALFVIKLITLLIATL